MDKIKYAQILDGLHVSLCQEQEQVAVPSAFRCTLYVYNRYDLNRSDDLKASLKHGTATAAVSFSLISPGKDLNR